MILQCKYFRATEGWDLEQQINEFIKQLPRESIVDIKYCEGDASVPPHHYLSVLIIFEA